MTTAAAVAGRTRALDAAPLVNSRLKVEETESGYVTIVIPEDFVKRPRWHRFVFLLPKDRSRHVELDEVGSFVWRTCDGETSVREIIHAVAEHYSFCRREAEVSVLGYLRSLGKRGFVGLQMEKTNE